MHRGLIGLEDRWIGVQINWDKWTWGGGGGGVQVDGGGRCTVGYENRGTDNPVPARTDGRGRGSSGTDKRGRQMHRGIYGEREDKTRWPYGKWTGLPLKLGTNGQRQRPVERFVQAQGKTD
jgi:hypothetical protein